MKTTKRFGARYGKRVKDRLQAIEDLQNSKQKCPYCHKLKVKRLSAGIFTCRKCGAKFTGRAYSLIQPKVEASVQAVAPEEPVEEEEEIIEEPEEPQAEEQNG
jgi:large subunit ribosomal protein L37Ae